MTAPEPAARLQWDLTTLGTVTMAGVDLGPITKSATLAIACDSAPILTLELDVLDVSAQGSPTPDIRIGPETAVLIEQAGWKSPGQIEMLGRELGRYRRALDTFSAEVASLRATVVAVQQERDAVYATARAERERLRALVAEALAEWESFGIHEYRMDEIRREAGIV